MSRSPPRHEDVEIRLEYEGAFDWVAFSSRRNDHAGALTCYFSERAGVSLESGVTIERGDVEVR